MKLKIAAIVAVSVLMMPTGGAAQTNPPETITEVWFCGDEITLTSRCSRDGRKCTGQIQTGNYLAQDAMFRFNDIKRIGDIERRWYWGGSTKDGLYRYAFTIGRPSMFGQNGNFYDFSDKSEVEPSRTYKCTKTK